MAIRKPLIEQFANVDGESLVASEGFLPVWDGVCDNCGAPVSVDEPYWDWVLRPQHAIHMHLRCLTDWASRIAKAAREVADLDV